MEGVTSDFATSPLDEPTVMWRMQRPGGLTSHLVLGREKTKAFWGVWFLNQTPLGIRDFDDLDTAVKWADRMQAQNWATGWRLVPEE